MIHPMADLLERARKPDRIVVGLMSGTSADSIDVAVCRISGQGGAVEVRLLEYREHPHDPEVRRRVIDLAGLDVRGVAELHARIGEAFAEAALEAIAAAGLSAADVDVIGSHGQTIYHHSGIAGAIRATLQLGDGDRIAVRTGCFVVSDFRARDVAAGGEGAPLSPIADAVLFRSSEGSRRRAILNLGGIANLTVLGEDPSRTFGFDTGPANAPLDRLARRISGGSLDCDRDGQIARSGRVDERWLEKRLARDPFPHRMPPKSTGFEMYGDAFVDGLAADWGGTQADLMATLVELVARTVAIGVGQCAQKGAPVDELIAAGGGVRNPALMERIAEAVGPIPVRRSDEVGVPSDAREAMAFAALADMTVRGEPAMLPPVTGARSPKLLGKLSFP